MARIIQIGNSRGVRLPQVLLERYGLEDGSEVALEELQEGILIRPSAAASKVSWDQAYREMADEGAEQAEWSEWEAVSGDGHAH